MSDEVKIGDFVVKASPYLHNLNDYTRRQATNHIVVHCSDTKAEWNGGIDEIREWHVHERGWMDVGYHFVIRRDGTIERGRPTWSVGAGVQGRNSDSLHLCLVGGRGPKGEADNNFTPRQMSALAFLIGTLLKQVAPGAKVLGHRDFPGVKKACPSFDVGPWWYGDGHDSAQTRAAIFFSQIPPGTSLPQ